MIDKQQVNRRIAKNSIFLYFRMIVTMAIGLYTSRVVLQVLGASDYGLYNVVGGVLTLFTLFSSALTIGTQRFLSYAIGDNDPSKLKRTFSIALGLHVKLAAIVLILAETVGFWFLYKFINIPDGRLTAAVWIYQFSVIAFLVNLVQIPFQSCLIAHERMNMYAYMSIYDAVMKLLIVYLIQWICLDKLIAYGFFVFAVNFTSVLIYNHYCRKHFAECTFRIIQDRQLSKEIINYTGWNLFGGSLSFFTGQGINILLNIFCGTVVNAARGLSISVNNIVTQFVNNFQVAVNPQIIKQFAGEEWESLYKLVINNARIAEYLLLLIAIPIFLETDFLLKLWLGEYPEYTAIFVQLLLLQTAESPLDYPFGMLIHASGKMKWPSIVTVVPLISIFFVSFFLLKTGYSPVSVYIASAVLYLWKNITDLYFAHKYSGISITRVLKEVYLNVIVGALIMFAIPYYITLHMETGWARFLVVGSVSVLTSIIVIYYWGMTPGMREMVRGKLYSRINKRIK